MSVISQKRESARAMILTSNMAASRVLASFLSKDPKFDFEIFQETKVKSAALLYKAQPFDLVLLGETVEGGSSLDFLDSIYASKEEWHPVIFVHFGKGHETCLDALRRGAKEYVELGSLTSYELRLTVERIRETLVLYQENRRVQKENAMMLLDLERSNQDLAQFAYAVSHDLKEPLRKIVSFGSYLVEKVEESSDPEVKLFAKRMMDGATRMGAMMSALLEFSRVSSSPGTKVWSPLQEALGRALDSLEMRINETGGKVTVESELPMVQGDPLRLEQLLQNLVGNALKYAREGVPPLVQIRSLMREDGSCQLSIMDNGIGFDPNQAHRIFGIFQRLHGRSSVYEGHGVGLAICKRIVEGIGGRIWAEGCPGEGASFFVEFPCAR